VSVVSCWACCLERALLRRRSRSPLARARLGDRSDVARLAGLTYLVGVVVLAPLWTMLLIAGVPFSLGLSWDFRDRHCRRIARRPATWRTTGAPHARNARTAARHCFWHLRVRARAGGLLRGARLSGLYWWDAWAFWVPKAKVIYFFGSIDPALFKELPARPIRRSYPCSMRPRSSSWEVLTS
jgi:hypothetical protein